MEKYTFPKEQLSVLEDLRQPFAVYQFVNRRVVTLALSAGFLKLFGYEDRTQAYYDMDYDMYKDVHPDDVVRIANAAYRFATEGGRYEVIYRTRNYAGPGYRVVHAYGEHVLTEEGVRLAHVWYSDEGLYAETADLSASEINQALNSALHEESILRSSQYDDLTGLPRMTYFFELAEAGKNTIFAEGGDAALLYMDLNGMKYFNHNNGFSEGDELLRSFARLLARTFSNENCCRIAADHFAVFTRDEDLEHVLLRLFEDCRHINNGRSLPVRVGIYSTKIEDVPVSTACDRAKAACVVLKKTFESGFSCYDQTLRDDMNRRQYILENLDRAIAEKWIRVYYQPIVRAVNGKVCEEEALARWLDPEEGLLSPADFIPHLESAGLLYKLDLYVLEQTLQKIRLQMTYGFHIMPHSINLSRSDFDACDIVEEIRRRVDDAGVGRDKITIEITESVIGSDFNFMKTQIERFQALGFAVWMDDFGSGYSSLDVLQSIRFDLLKFDMSFMRKLDEGDSAKIILTELMKMATSLGVDTVCEGVETEAQVRFLQEIGCSKLQGFYFCRAIPLEEIVARNEKGIQIGYENPEESAYFEAIGRVNLYDLGLIAQEGEGSLQNAFNMLPMGIIEVSGDSARFLRSNPSYRDFIMRFFHVDLAEQGSEFTKYSDAFMKKVARTCCEQGARSFYDEKMPDGSTVHSFARRVSSNPVTGTYAVAVAVLSITGPDEGASYADIARAMAADYYNIYVVDLDTERFIEYTSPVGGEELAMERHGTDFFASARNDTMTRIYSEDREMFLSWFTRENIIRELDARGVFTSTYRLVDTGVPIYVNMKITRLQRGGNRIILGVSIIDSQMKQKARIEEMQKERDALTRIMALSDGYLSLYTVDPVTGRYLEFSSTDAYDTLGLAKEGEDFFTQSLRDIRERICPEDYPFFCEHFTRENVMREIRESGSFRLHYRLMIHGEPRHVSLKIAPFREGEEEKLAVGVRAWVERRQSAPAAE